MLHYYLDVVLTGLQSAQVHPLVLLQKLIRKISIHLLANRDRSIKCGSDARPTRSIHTSVRNSIHPSGRRHIIPWAIAVQYSNFLLIPPLTLHLPPTGSVRSAVAAPLLTSTGRLQNLEGAHERVVDGHHGTGVVELSAVVRGREDGNELSSGKELEEEIR